MIYPRKLKTKDAIDLHIPNNSRLEGTTYLCK